MVATVENMTNMPASSMAASVLRDWLADSG
jgi:hypothetical protein